MPLKSVALPEGAEAALLAALNQGLDQLAHRLATLGEEDAFNRTLANPAYPQVFFRRLLLFASLALLLYVVYRVGVRSRYRPETGMPRLERVLHQHAPGGAVLDLREEALLASGNLWEAAHEVARECFTSAGFAPGEVAAPRVEAIGGWWARQRAARRVARLWRLAIGSVPSRVSAFAWRRVLRDADEMRAAMGRGELRLVGKSA